MTGKSISEPTGLLGRFSPRTQTEDRHSDVHEVASQNTAADINHQSSTHNGLECLANTPDSTSRLLSDEENEQMNRKIDRLIAAIDDRRPIHFAPDAETGEVEIFADHYDQESDQDKRELEQNIATSPENFGRIIRFDNVIRSNQNPYSLQYATSSDSWASTDSKKSSSNAWERAVAVANIRFALEHGRLVKEAAVLRQRPFRGSDMKIEAPRGRRLVRTAISPIPLDFNKPLRTSTPSIHSNGSELDTSSPLFRMSCERMYRDMYAEPPASIFQRGPPESSPLDECVSVSEPPGEDSAETREPKMSGTTGRVFGVFEDGRNGEPSSKGNGKLAIRSKALKDISNLRRLGYLRFNSFAKDAKSSNNQADTTVSATSSSTGIGGATDLEPRRAYIKSKWPGLLEDPGNASMEVSLGLDGVARRRNEQAIGRPIDRLHYSLSHMRTSTADSSLNANPIRQAHFDLALARLEGRALPPPPSPIHRHPDSAALFDCDIRGEGTHRPLPLRGPRPSGRANRTPRWALRGTLV